MIPNIILVDQAKGRVYLSQCRPIFIDLSVQVYSIGLFIIVY